MADESWQMSHIRFDGRFDQDFVTSNLVVCTAPALVPPHTAKVNWVRLILIIFAISVLLILPVFRNLQSGPRGAT